MTAPTPALVSGPNQLSKRTDTGQPVRSLPDAKYGENRDFIAQQQSAPLAKGPDRPATPLPSEMGGGGGGPLAMPSDMGVDLSSAMPPPEITGLSAPSAYPDQHVTTGMQMGAQPQRQEPQFKPGQLSDALRPYAAADDSGVINDLIWQLTDQGI